MTRLLLSLTFVFLPLTHAAAQLAVQAEMLYTMAGAPLKNGVVLIKDGKIEAVGANLTIPNGYRTLKAKVVTPGLIDAHSVVGLAGILNYNHDQDQLELSEAIQPELRAEDAYNAEERLVKWIRDHGVTTVHTGHGPGALASGQTMIVKTDANTVTEAIVQTPAMVAFTLGTSVSQNYKKPGTRAKGAAMLREEFLKAQDYAKRMQAKDPSKRPARDLRMEILNEVLTGKLPALFTVHRATDILTALRLQKEFGFKLVLDGAAEAYLVIDDIKKAGVPVIVHPPMMRTVGDGENASLETAAKLRQAGIKVALQSGYESYVPKTRVVLFEAAIAAANGLSFEEALRTITIDAAEILGIAKRVGSLEKGKDADLVLFDGDPFEYTSHVCTVIINGKIVKEPCN
jgi:imidazolonepropionase-like amidohydrolase